MQIGSAVPIFGDELTQNAEKRTLVELKVADEERRLVYAWASIARKADGSLPVDSQGDVVDTPEAQKAWEDSFYSFLPFSPTADDMHQDFDVAQIVGGMVFTPELTSKLGIPDGILPTGALVVVRIPRTTRGDELWSDISTGKRSMMSIVAAIRREELGGEDE